MSTVISQSAGMMLRLSDACALVGATVSASSGSISSPASDETARAAASASPRSRNLAEQRLQEALDLRDQLRLDLERAQPRDQRRGLDECVVGDRRHRCVPAAAVHLQ